MKNFKPDQKVVFIDQEPNSNPIAICPKDYEVVTILCKCNTYAESWDLKEYPLSKKNRKQCFHERHLFPLDEIFGKQSQADVERIEKEIEQLIPVEL